MCGIASTHVTESAENQSALLRRALAERLHDGPLQELVALQLKAGNLARLGASSLADQQERLAELGSLAQRAIEQLHAVVRELGAEHGGELELFGRLVDLCEQFRAASGLYCVVHLERAHLEVAPAVGNVLHRSVRELLANVRKHAQATKVEVRSARRDDGAVVIMVADNGIGMVVQERHADPFRGGFGVPSIEHRLKEIGASLEIEADDGTRAAIVLPGS